MLFRSSLFQHTYSESTGSDSLAKAVIDQQTDIDAIIEKAAPEWPIAKLNRVDLSILRLAIYELMQTDQPSKVIIDEAVELAKSYGADNSPKFINGALGAATEIIEEKAKH